MRHLRTLPLLLLLSGPVFAATERELLEDRIRWLEEQLAKQRAKLAELDARLLAAERKRVGFNPGPIASTGRKVTAKTPLKPGLELQVEWCGQWWAARVVRIEGDKVRIHYPGWAYHWDEAVSRDRLQLDPDAATKARAAGTMTPPIPIIVQPGGAWRALKPLVPGR
jgi:hypothetical protein